jgi:hypothetical protein
MALFIMLSNNQVLPFTLDGVNPAETGSQKMD